MKNIILTLAAIALFSCDDRNFFDDINQKPTVKIVKDNADLVTSLSDSLKTSLKTGKDYYAVNVLVTDPEGLLKSISAQLITGTGKFFQGGKETTDFNFTDGQTTFQYYPTTDGLHQIKILGTDQLDASGVSTLDLLVFNNLKPVAAMDISKVGINSDYEYELDGSRSYDQDANVGGGIAQWEWDINGTKILTKTAKSRFIFPSKGTYEIKLYAIDNDGEKSDLVSRILTLN